MRILISGAGIGGPALAYWLARYGHRPTVVELAPGPRAGGQAVDFRGPTHLTVLRRMGLLDELRAHRTGGTPMTFTDPRGRTRLRLPAEFAGGEVEIPRGDLVRLLHRHSAPGTEYLFGDTATALRQRPDGVLVSFRHAPERHFDLVIGADGLHSRVRALAFGPERRYVRHLGYYAATWPFPNRLGLPAGSTGINTPGRLAAAGADPRDPDRAGAFLLFASPELPLDRHDPARLKALLRERFADLPHPVPHLLATLDEVDDRDLYVDSISRADVPAWSDGRIALLGDAACGATIGGMGTGTALVAAYVLAAELARADGDHRTALTRYERTVRPYARRCQRGGDRTGPFLAPRTARGLWLRNTLLGRRPLLDRMLAMGEDIATLDLPEPARAPQG
ncbi:2-polyprenyl-6-methoxyphenol hydroxylase-like FAD-dependent oxidoreductase [Kitasatospora sp. SolWspMP-SS2h]|uniref:FAD-dependent monooxygenase n=1 Tax=Kitasatospora sp. SolWspMP-SS2h TaxID=1305729 RepID=UPI000DBF6C58|nr:FAD-dependent monooxygenase [Kitasatospora sp. SolWspMP-SS2h]RAJ46898.1 2-polyprenyl-6-methoxyphenol hydroxylase-like FAD-dependent oxidoreductase [Kitasatospora sp. SolWspMP-SS2h]